MTRTSRYKTPDYSDWIMAWALEVQHHIGCSYESIRVPTTYGQTHVWAFGHEDKTREPIVFLPGFRTPSLFWDINGTLEQLRKHYRVYLVDVVGQPGLSSGLSPRAKGGGYGNWLVEVLDYLGLERVHAAGYSFGSFLLFKLAEVAPERIQKVVMMAPAGIVQISLAPVNLFFNLLPVFRPSRSNAVLFLNKVVFSDEDLPSAPTMELLTRFVEYTLYYFQNGADFPYVLPLKQLQRFKSPTLVLLGEKDPLFSANALVKKLGYIPGLKKVTILPNHGHGVEYSPLAAEAAMRFFQG